MSILLTIFHVLVCVFLILVVLTQQGKGQDLASAFGGAGSQAAFGARGTATLLTRVTAVVAGLFMVTSLLLGYVSTEATEATVVPDSGASLPGIDPADVLGADPIPETEAPETEGPATEEPPPAESPGEGGSPEAGTPEAGGPGGEPNPGEAPAPA